jgi:hypothetical protein
MKFDNRQLIKDFILLKKLQINKWLPHKAVQIRENTNFGLHSGIIYKLKTTDMKKKVIATSMFLLSIFLFCQHGYSQAIVNNDYSLIFDDRKGGEFKSVNAKIVLNPAGNIQITATFQLPKGHFLVPKSGTKTIGVKQTTNDIYGEPHVLWCITNINSSGRFSVNYHLNGAGTVFPAVYSL